MAWLGVLVLVASIALVTGAVLAGAFLAWCVCVLGKAAVRALLNS